MKSLLRLLLSMSRWERWAVAFLAVLFTFGLGGMLRVFYLDNTELLPSTGGTYIEGSVGELQPLNPWFVVRNDVNRDIISLVFAGLLKYDPQTKAIVDDLALLQASADGRVYTLKLKDGIVWHDATEKAPHPVTADDVVFTFATIQHPEFPNGILRQNFSGVQIEKMDVRTVRFTLDQPYSFFPSNLTVGLLPKRSFEDIPVGKLDLATDFGLHPVGAGPYRVKNVVQTDLSTEVTLERFERTLKPPFRLDRIVFRIFSDYSSLLSDLRNLDGVRLVPKNDQGEPMIPRRYTARQYYLPQYVALFFNLQRKHLQDEKLRLGLQLGTDKQAVAASVHESVLVDTPFLELDVSDWRYHFDPAAAQGALFSSQWHQPEKIRLQRLLEMDDANRVGVLKVQSVVQLETGAVLTVTGALTSPEGASDLNGVPVVRHPTQTGSWIVSLPTVRGTGALLVGDNLLRLADAKGRVLDSANVYRAGTADDFRRAVEEQRLLRLFQLSRAGKLPAGQEPVTVQDLFLDRGKLRLRTANDPVSIRRNDRGEELAVTLLTSPAPAEYRKVADAIAKSWGNLGVRVTVEVPKTRDDFQDRLLRRDYDVVLFGQSLLDNLDCYPYWHSSGVQKLTGNQKDLRQDAYNLSQYASFRADALLETIRRTRNDQERTRSLQELRDLFKKDVPAVFLYSPMYTFAHHQNIQGVELGSLSLHSDRFLTLYQWYARQVREFKSGRNWLSVFTWMPSLFVSDAEE
ncbi:MAG: ABC transporter substrate-binding protein [Candidatus Peribacteraceae bacterium]|nr:ABC transporter substrate-binding protein [Candidatus Peribacteraceae bacterium]